MEVVQRTRGQPQRSAACVSRPPSRRVAAAVTKNHNGYMAILLTGCAFRTLPFILGHSPERTLLWV